VEVRDAVFATESDAQSAAISARKGADLGALAREKGVRKEVVLPPVPRDELSPKELSDAVFALPPGGVSGAIAVREGDRTLYHVFKLVKRYPARNEPWSAMRDEIESGLAEKPLEPWEYLQWAGRMRVRYRVEALS
jgi:parvulin-like peptidyl-prolyl isomerase